MKFPSFKQFITEEETKSWIKSTFNNFKSELESKVKEITNLPFRVVGTDHYFEQVTMRTGIDHKFKTNIGITESEIVNIYDKIINKFFNVENGNGGIIKIKSPNIFKIKKSSLVVNKDNTQSGEWEFQHKIKNIDDPTNFRCAVYVIKFIMKKENGKDVITNKPEVRMITMLPTNKEGKDDFPDTNSLNESIDHDNLNFIED